MLTGIISELRERYPLISLVSKLEYLPKHCLGTTQCRRRGSSRQRTGDPSHNLDGIGLKSSDGTISRRRRGARACGAEQRDGSGGGREYLTPPFGADSPAWLAASGGGRGAPGADEDGRATETFLRLRFM